MTKFLVLFIILLAPLALFAETEEAFFEYSCNSDNAYSEKDSEYVLTKLQLEYSKTKMFESQFTQKSYLASLDIQEMSSGNVYYAKPGKMLWKYLDPEKQEFLIKDNTYWYFQEDLNQLMIDEFRDVAISDLPVSFLLGLGNLKDNFTIESACKFDKSSNLLILKPKKEEELVSLKILISKNFPSVVHIEHLGGNKTQIFLNTINKRPKLKEETFVINAPEGTDVIDSRKS